MNTQEILLDACQKLFALVVAPDIFDQDHRDAILNEARRAIAVAAAERN